MIRYVAFLRGINVGGYKLIKMQDLSKVFSSLGFRNVKTFIQSGNVIFEDLEKTDALAKKIEEKLRKVFGYEIKVMLRTIDEIKDIIKFNPFKKIKGEAKLYVAFLSEEPKNKDLEPLKSEVEYFMLRDNEVFAVLRKDMKTRFSNNFLEKKLGVAATTRNWNVIRKIVEL